MKIIKAGTYGYYDVFQGEGWYKHTRVQLKKTKFGKTLSHVSGEEFKPWQLRQLLLMIK